MQIHMNTPRIAVYCSARENLPQNWVEAARTLGQWIGSRGATLVYGGVNAGLMTIVANAAKNAGAKVVGVIPARLRARVCPANDMKLTTGSLDERKRTMDILSDIFVVLPGGYGTLDEFATTFSYLNFTRQPRPIVLANLDGIFDPLLEQLNLMCRHGLIDPEAMTILHVCRTIEEVESTLATLTPNN